MYRLSWNETLGSQFFQQIITVTVSGTANNHTFLPSKVEAPVGTLLHFYFDGVSQPLAALRYMHPCEDFNGTTVDLQPQDMFGDLIAEMRVDGFDVQYMFFADLDFRLNCDDKSIFTLQPRRGHAFPTGVSGHAFPTGIGGKVFPTAAGELPGPFPTGAGGLAASGGASTTDRPYGTACGSMSTIRTGWLPTAISPFGTISRMGTATAIRPYATVPSTTAIFPPITNSAAAAGIVYLIAFGELVILAGFDVLGLRDIL